MAKRAELQIQQTRTPRSKPDPSLPLCSALWPRSSPYLFEMFSWDLSMLSMILRSLDRMLHMMVNNVACQQLNKRCVTRIFWGSRGCWIIQYVLHLSYIVPCLFSEGKKGIVCIELIRFLRRQSNIAVFGLDSTIFEINSTFRKWPGFTFWTLYRLRVYY